MSKIEACNSTSDYLELFHKCKQLTKKVQSLLGLVKEARKIVKASSSGRAGAHSDWMERTKDLS